MKDNNIEAEIIKVEDIVEIMEYNIMSTPGLVVNEKVVSKGRVPSEKEINKYFIRINNCFKCYSL